jgi:hypothetical protein
MLLPLNTLDSSTSRGSSIKIHDIFGHIIAKIQ